ncbi:unnamed protein product [Protopolystoma xenopodis]|uniref:Uncharacterized protein n=1 Tax=Protopolystoma xenopodis TaxID=117903 RepID=A0A448WJ44_9PLAT|nr:unnamed protein product [Protopolystoma xenopodis]
MKTENLVVHVNEKHYFSAKHQECQIVTGMMPLPRVQRARPVRAAFYPQSDLGSAQLRPSRGRSYRPEPAAVGPLPILSSRMLDANWREVTCTVTRRHADLRVFFACPQLTTPCLEDCRPQAPICPSGPEAAIESAMKNSTLDTPKDRIGTCIPGPETLSCARSVTRPADGAALPDGASVEQIKITLRIDQRDRRLEGRWHCSHEGQGSSVFEVRL